MADTLSRNAVNAISLGLNYSDIARGQLADGDLTELQRHRENLKWAKYNIQGHTLHCETSTGRPRPYLPLQFRHPAFDLVHSLSHPSSKSSIKLLTERYIWENMKVDIRKWLHECTACQKDKISCHMETGIGKMEA